MPNPRLLNAFCKGISGIPRVEVIDEVTLIRTRRASRVGNVFLGAPTFQTEPILGEWSGRLDSNLIQTRVRGCVYSEQILYRCAEDTKGRYHSHRESAENSAERRLAKRTT